MKTVTERFLELVTKPSTSCETSATVPSTPCQKDLALFLLHECEKMGLTDCFLSDTGYVYARLPKTAEGFHPLGFIAHMDTSPDAPGENVHPVLTRNYDGSDIILPHRTISPSQFPDLLLYQGQDILTSDGSTLLGADDKAGIAEILAAIETLVTHPEIPHGEIALAFTPDEEIGRGADHFDIARFGADFAYTVDGGKLGELEYENFNAASAVVHITGVNVHPGTAKGLMKNALLMANEFISAFPANETPAHTEGYEGFFHLNQMEGNVSDCTLHYIIRDFDKERFTARKALFETVTDQLNAHFGDCITVTVQDQYYNMAEKLAPHPHIVALAKEAMESVGVTPLIGPIRGGTDGARLSFEGLPCPNLFAGGHNFHGVYEFVPVQSMEKAVEVLLAIAKNAKKEKKA